MNALSPILYGTPTGVLSYDLLPTTGRASQGGPLTMSSREIAELLNPENPRHDNVKVTIERLANRGVMGLPAMQDVVNHLGQRVRVYLLDKRSSLIVVAQLSPEFTARVVDRWQELEAQVAAGQFRIPQTRAEALRLAADMEERAIAAEEKLAIAGPKANALDELTKAEGTYTLTEAAKHFGIAPRKEFIKVLMDFGILYKRGKNSPILPNEKYLQAGYFVLKTESRGYTIWQKTRVTPKGLAWLATKLHRFTRKESF